MDKESKTAGQLSQELAQSTDKYELGDLFKEKMKSISGKLEQTATHGCKTYSSSFYIVIECKRERLMPNIDRSYIFHRVTCPTPHYDQIVYYHDRKKGSTECLWSLPEKNSCQKIMNNPIYYQSWAPDMTRCVLDFYDGTLLNKALKQVEKDDNLIEETYV